MTNMLTPKEIDERRKRAGLSVDEFGALLGVHRATLYRWLQGQDMTMNNYRKVMAVLEKLPIHAAANSQEGDT